MAQAGKDGRAVVSRPEMAPAREAVGSVGEPAWRLCEGELRRGEAR